MHRLGIPGVGFLPENKRVYPNGVAAAHVLGFANIDNVGIAGIEKYIDSQGLQDLNGAGFAIGRRSEADPALDRPARPARLRDELVKAHGEVQGQGRGRRHRRRQHGEVVALVSLPDFDPNNPVDALDKDRINRINVGVFEMGSTFKALTTAMALDSGQVQHQLDLRCALGPALRPLHDQRLSRPSTAC